jgi:hypothetical protein
MLNAACGGVELGLCGSRTKIGIGEDASITPQTAEPRTAVLRLPLSSPPKYVGTLSVTFTWTNAVGTIAAGAIDDDGSPGTMADPGNLTSTKLVVESLLYPLYFAYTHGEAVELGVQLKAVPLVNP